MNSPIPPHTFGQTVVDMPHTEADPDAVADAYQLELTRAREGITPRDPHVFVERLQDAARLNPPPYAETLIASIYRHHILHAARTRAADKG